MKIDAMCLTVKSSFNLLDSRRIRHTTFLFFVLVLAACKPGGEGSSIHNNRLAKASSPYLREHADNPVDWYEWGPEALEKSSREGKPLLISIGYASCHWCHVMERESFMDTAIARFMNDHFVSIKVDREERPDVDQIYISAAQLISGNAGWPLNAFALPDGKPFYAATYFPKDQWLKVLQQINRAYAEDHENVLKQAEAVTNGIKTSESVVSVNLNQNKFDKQTYQNIFNEWQSHFDYQSGGLSGSPKFPMPMVWEYLLQHHYLTGNKKSLEAVTTTLNNLKNGGIFDQLGGGFARYSTDENWRVPHFEKMLYDNGQLVSLFSHAYQQTKDSTYVDVVLETLEFIKQEMTSPEGGFYSSINADSEGEEGKFYVWTKAEIERSLDSKSASLLTEYFNVTESGNWENQKNILYRKELNEGLAAKYSLTKDEMKETLSMAKRMLLTERNKRVRPSLDDKIITSWNALMLTGYVDAYLATANAEFLDAALKNARFIDRHMIQQNGKMWRSYSGGRTSVEAFLDDYAFLARAYLRLYEATFDIHWLAQARLLTEYTLQHFHDKPSGLFYYTSDDSESLIARKIELVDNVIPSSNAVMGEVLYKLGLYYDLSTYQELSKSMMNQFTTDMIKAGPFYASWASLMGLITYEPYEVAIMGDRATRLSQQMQVNYLPTSLFMGGTEENLPLLENKLVTGQDIIYVCRNKVCKLPVKEIETAMQQIK